MKLAVLTAGLGLILMLLEARETPETPGGAHSLCLNFTVRAQVSRGQPWCETQGSVDGKSFLQYDSESNKFTPVSLLGEMVNDTKVWRDMTQTLKDVVQELRIVLLLKKLENSLSWDPFSLQAKLCCQREARQYTGASWEFDINGKTALIDTKSMNWIVIDPGARVIKEEWESNQHLSKFFKMTSNADCHHWLKEFLEPWEKILEPTVSPGTTQSSSSTKSIAGINPVNFIYLVLIVALI